MHAEKIRPIAICVCRDGDRILVAEGRDSKKNQVFYRPLGGMIEFGERGEETVTRELMEEIGATLTDVRYLGTLENIFVYEGRRGHEIVLVYDGKLADRSLYQNEVIQGDELGQFSGDSTGSRLAHCGILLFTLLNIFPTIGPSKVTTAITTRTTKRRINAYLTKP